MGRDGCYMTWLDPFRVAWVPARTLRSGPARRMTSSDAVSALPTSLLAVVVCRLILLGCRVFAACGCQLALPEPA
jgi:hypothetical protein